MRAVVVKKFGSARSATVMEVDEPVPGPKDVLVGTATMGVNFRDTLMIEGRYHLRPPLPFSPGMECAGVVLAVGAAVTEFDVGDRVAGEVDYGAYAERVIVSEDSCFRVPETMSFEHAAALGLVYQAAHFALTDHAHMSGGERVVVTGAAGGVGLAAVQLAKAMGGRVIAGVRDESQRQIVIDAGADEVVDLSDEVLHDHLATAIVELTNEHGADVLIDPVGGDVFKACLEGMAHGGRMVVIGFASGQVPMLPLSDLLRRNLSVMGLNWRYYRLNEPARVARIQQEMYELYTSGKLTPHVMHTYPMEDFAEALDVIAAGNVQGKVVLSVGHPS